MFQCWTKKPQSAPIISPALISSQFYCSLIFLFIPFGLTGFAPNMFCSGQHMAHRHTHTHTHGLCLCGLRSPVKTKPGSASANTGHCYGHPLPSPISPPCGGPGLGEVMYWHRSQLVQLYKESRTRLARLCGRALLT